MEKKFKHLNEKTKNISMELLTLGILELSGLIWGGGKFFRVPLPHR